LPSSSKRSPPTEVEGLTADLAPDASGVDDLHDRLGEVLVRTAGDDAVLPLSVLLRGEGGRVAAGLDGWTWGGCCELVALWVDEPLRGGGLGRWLLSLGEAEAAERACTQVVLMTHSVAPPSFYLRAGYELVGTVDGYPSGSAAHWLRKRLSSP
jgi:GNAT superfamily N-acetyltransferase